MRNTALGILLLSLTAACAGADDIWGTLFREKLKEANAGSSNAQYDMGMLYQNGRGVAANRARAIEWYRKAAAQQNQNAVSRLKLMQANEERFSKTLVGAEGGDAESQYDIGRMYTEGIGVDADLARAISWYEKAAAQGYVKAEFKLGQILYEGGGTKSDMAIAFDLFRRAATEGYPAAQFYLGKMYASGEGVERDYQSALVWYDKAVTGGFDEARRGMIDVAERLKGGPAARQTSQGGIAAVARGPAEPLPRQTRAYSYENLLSAAWLRDGSPVEYLPSAISTCAMENERLVCFSDEQQRATEASAIRYKTKAIVEMPSNNGSFVVTYRRLVLDSEQTMTRAAGSGDEILGSVTEGQGGIRYAVKTGWSKEHNLECSFSDASTLDCLKDKTYAFVLESPQTLAAGK